MEFVGVLLQFATSITQCEDKVLPLLALVANFPGHLGICLQLPKQELCRAD